MTEDYAHLYDDADQLAGDVAAWVAADGVVDWDGNEPLARRMPHREDFVVTADAINAANPEYWEDVADTGRMARLFVAAYSAASAIFRSSEQRGRY